MSILNNDETMLKAAHASATEAAKLAAQDHLDKYYGGQDAGACGFAWVTFYPKNKGNTKLGKLERKLIESIGFRKDYTGKSWQLWNPADARCQNVDAKYAGAEAYAKILGATAGVKVSPADRLD